MEIENEEELTGCGVSYCATCDGAFYKGEDVVLKAGGILSIADGLAEVVLPTCAMKIVKNLIIIKNDVK